MQTRPAARAQPQRASPKWNENHPDNRDSKASAGSELTPIWAGSHCRHRQGGLY
jgi:hypothetical protein